MKKIIKKIFFGKMAFQSLFRRLFDIAIEGMNIGTGGRSFNESGERFAVAHALGKSDSPVVFDVGAQGGEYTKNIVDFTHGKARIYAFEPCLKDYLELHELFRNNDNITLINSALGETSGRGTLYYPEHIRGLSSLYKPNENFNKSEQITIDTVDNFCGQNNIQRIDLLKLDTEGNELKCLLGSRQMLKNIARIQFEFCISARDSRTYFKDIFEFLSDYKIYRILQDGLYEIKSPEKITELLFTTNYLAERKV